MARSAGDGRRRMEQAALDLFARQGFEATTAAQIAEAAGVTERTFFRHFADKREVLFPDAEGLRSGIAAAAGELPHEGPGATSMAVVRVLMGRFAEVIEGRAAVARQRHTVIARSADLQERELAKMAALAVAVADALRARGVPEPAASLAAEVGVASVRVAYARWIDDPASPLLTRVLDDCFDALIPLLHEG